MGSKSARSWFITWQSAPVRDYMGIPSMDYLDGYVLKTDGAPVFAPDDSSVRCAIEEFSDYSYILPYDNLSIKYTIVFSASCYEYGSEEGKLHFHAYIRFRQTVSSAYILRYMPSCSASPARGSVYQALDYIEHTGKHRDKPGLLRIFDRYGSLEDCRESRGGTSSDSVYAEIFDRMENGEDLISICREFPSIGIRNYFSLRKMYADIQHASYMKKESVGHVQ